MTDKPESGAIQLDNQSIQVKILMPSGRFHVTDKVSGLQWSLAAGSGCGTLWFEENQAKTKYSLGHKGSQGVLFTTNYYSIRYDADDDFNEASLTGVLGDDPETTVTIRYLLSSTYPILDCFCHVDGKKADYVSKIVFPLGFQLPLSPQNHIFLPTALTVLKPLEQCGPQLPLWDPVEKENHQVAGSPFFILSKRDNKKSSSCMGFMQDPLSLMEIQHTPPNRFLSSMTPKAQETGCSEDFPYKLRYQFFPSDDLRAVYWLCYEYLNREDQ